MKKLLTPFKNDNLELKNHLVMAPMNRARAIDNVPNDLMAEYYGQRTGAGLIITGGTAPMADGLGYPRTPGIFTEDQVEGWKKVTEQVHEGGSKFFVQLMHTGRIAHEDNVPKPGKIVAPSAIRAEGEIFTDKGLKDYSTPKALTADKIKGTITGHAKAAENAIRAGFDGVELHGAHGYLAEQFLNPNSNQRGDEYGGSIENRARFLIEIIQAIADSIGAGKVGIRLSPYATLNDQPAYGDDEVYGTYKYIAEALQRIGITYIHLSMQEAVPDNIYQIVREKFSGSIIQSNGLTPQTASQALDGFADLVGFARPFLANPDLVKRIEVGAELNEPNPDTFYTPGPEGYVDYPTLDQQLVGA